MGEATEHYTGRSYNYDHDVMTDLPAQQSRGLYQYLDAAKRRDGASPRTALQRFTTSRIQDWHVSDGINAQDDSFLDAISTDDEIETIVEFETDTDANTDNDDGLSMYGDLTLSSVERGHHQINVSSISQSSFTKHGGDEGIELTLTSPQFTGSVGVFDLFRWVHLHEDVMDFEDFIRQALAQFKRGRRSFRILERKLRDIQKTYERSVHWTRDGKQARVMEPFLYTEDDFIQPLGKITLMCLPYFLLDFPPESDRWLQETNHPPLSLLQTLPSAPTLERHTQQVVAVNEEEPMYFHVSQLWALVIDDRFICTCARLPSRKFFGDSIIQKTVLTKSAPHIKVSDGGNCTWNLPVERCPTWFALTSHFMDIGTSQLDIAERFDEIYTITLGYRIISSEDWQEILDLAKRGIVHLVLTRKEHYEKIQSWPAKNHSSLSHSASAPVPVYVDDPVWNSGSSSFQLGQRNRSSGHSSPGTDDDWAMHSAPSTRSRRSSVPESPAAPQTPRSGRRSHSDSMSQDSEASIAPEWGLSLSRTVPTTRENANTHEREDTRHNTSGSRSPSEERKNVTNIAGTMHPSEHPYPIIRDFGTTGTTQSGSAEGALVKYTPPENSDLEILQERNTDEDASTDSPMHISETADKNYDTKFHALSWYADTIRGETFDSSTENRDHGQDSKQKLSNFLVQIDVKLESITSTKVSKAYQRIESKRLPEVASYLLTITFVPHIGGYPELSSLDTFYIAAVQVFELFLDLKNHSRVARKYWGAVFGILKNILPSSEESHEYREQFEIFRRIGHLADTIQSDLSPPIGPKHGSIRLPQDFGKAWTYCLQYLALVQDPSVDAEKCKPYIEKCETMLFLGRRYLWQLHTKEPLQAKEVASPLSLLSVMVQEIQKDICISDLKPNIAHSYREYWKQLVIDVGAGRLKRSLPKFDPLQREITAILKALRAQSDTMIRLCRAIETMSTGWTYIHASEAEPAARLEIPMLKDCITHVVDRIQLFETMLRDSHRLEKMTDEHLKTFTKERHDNAIYVFTIFTVIFLPLSFVCSFLGMNTADVRGMSSSQSVFWAAALPLTFIVIVIALLLTHELSEFLTVLREKFGIPVHHIAKISQYEHRLRGQKGTLWRRTSGAQDMLENISRRKRGGKSKDAAALPPNGTAPLPNAESRNDKKIKKLNARTPTFGSMLP